MAIPTPATDKPSAITPATSSATVTPDDGKIRAGDKESTIRGLKKAIADCDEKLQDQTISERTRKAYEASKADLQKQLDSLTLTGLEWEKGPWPGRQNPDGPVKYEDGLYSSMLSGDNRLVGRTVEITECHIREGNWPGAGDGGHDARPWTGGMTVRFKGSYERSGSKWFGKGGYALLVDYAVPARDGGHYVKESLNVTGQFSGLEGGVPVIRASSVTPRDPTGGTSFRLK
ncbi:MAG: hypothetical protein ACYDBB_10530 [Armatimonadota bacterium]